MARLLSCRSTSTSHGRTVVGGHGREQRVGADDVAWFLDRTAGQGLSTGGVSKLW
jgi:hypothetical protein